MCEKSAWEWGTRKVLECFFPVSPYQQLTKVLHLLQRQRFHFFFNCAKIWKCPLAITSCLDPFWVHHWVFLVSLDPSLNPSGSVVHINPLSSGFHIHFSESVSENPCDFLSILSCLFPRPHFYYSINIQHIDGTTSFLDISLPLVSWHPNPTFYLHWLKSTLLYWFFVLSMLLKHRDLLPSVSCHLVPLCTDFFGGFNQLLLTPTPPPL